MSAEDTISVRGASEHNLRAVDVDLPRGALVVVTGVSGSGKSSLAFDTLYAEGRRRYLETFSSYARQFLGKVSRPAVERIDGLSPALAVDQLAVIRSPRSTVGTLTELYDFLRLLWARVGVAPPGATARLERRLFSFNSPHGACPACHGLGVEDRIDPDLLVADPERTLRQGALRITTPKGYLIYSQVTLEVLDQVCRAHGFSVDVPWRELEPGQRDVVLGGSDRIRIPYGKHPLASRLRWSGITARPREEGTYKGILPVMEQILRQKRNRNILRFVRSLPCRRCRGTRLRDEALAVTVRDRSIAEVAALSVQELRRFFEDQLRPLAGTEAPEVALAIGRHVLERCDLLERLGLGYLSLDRDATTLSGGEAQRLRLARLAGIELSGVLFVLDEPSLGLHHRDTARLLEVLRRIRARGNTVLVVEHDEQVMRGADWLVDIGPGAGASGGELLYSGPATALCAQPPAETPSVPDRSLTREFLAGRQRIALPPSRRPGTGSLVFEHLTRHNLRDVSVELKAGALNVITGVSGAGKSTLVGEVVGSLRARLSGQSPAIDKIIEIDQAPIGRTPRSNPATYTGLFDRIRALFAAEPEAVRRGFGKGRFSFNVVGGRCETCEGAGVLQVGLHFLGTVSVVCESCSGRRFNEDTRAVEHRGMSIDEVLATSIDDAAELFADEAAIARGLATLRTLGLGYLALGHPATALSGGEAQRVKLAAELARPGTGRTLYVLDEPTTGLHTADLQRLLDAIVGLVRAGNTVVAVEHHLDVIRVADWVIDLGPGSGAESGRVVAMGTPEAVAAEPSSLTGAALREVLCPGASARPDGLDAEAAPHPARGPEPIRLANVTTHNLRHLDVEIPANRLTVITGVSGSGKSSLAFDTLFAEGQRRFADSFSVYARRFLPHLDEAELDEASGLTPTIAIRQHAPSRNPRSSVATVTEILDHYRLLFARAGSRRCPRCGAALALGRCGACGCEGVRQLTASMFSPNTEQGACPRCGGLGHVLVGDPARLITDPSRPLAGGAMAGHKTGRFYGDSHGQHMAVLEAAGAALGLDFSRPWVALDDRAREVAMQGGGDLELDVSWTYARGARRGTQRFRSRWPGLLELLRQEYERKHADRRGEALEALMSPADCPDCHGGKLKPEFLAVRFGGTGIGELLAMTVEASLAFFASLERDSADLDARTLVLTRELRAEVTRRLTRLRDAGLGYLSLDRSSASLSGGEAQRVRLTSQLGSGLTGITYVLDEPTIGLHPRDTQRLIHLLQALRDAGNTVVVVEHDQEVIASADHLIEVGPGAGREGGLIVAQGPPLASATRAVAPALERPRSRRALRPGLSLRGATAHNLRDLDVEIPAGGLVVVTGVSGSGKSSLVFDALAPSLERALASGAAGTAAVGCRELRVHADLGAVVRVGHAAVRASPWSNPATATGLIDRFRDLYADTELARSRGLRGRHFSTQTRGGRCEACEGIGRIKISMDFLPDVWVACEDCAGRRYRPEILECTVAGRSIADVLELSVDEALGFARELPPRHAAGLAAGLEALRQVGLGYLHLGQPTGTLSGGERQRLLLATSLLERRDGTILYLLDEPTTGLHARDVARLLEVFDRLIEAGHSLVVIEHDLDLVRAADWVIDLGPEGGTGGGRLVAAGTVETVAACGGSHTGMALCRAAAASGEARSSG